MELSVENNKGSDVWMWHRRLGHASFGYLHKLFPSLFVKNDVSQFKCDVCEMAKSHQTSFPTSLNKSSVLFMVVHSDVWGLSKIASLGGAHWFVTFIDDCTRMTWVTLLKSKSDVSMAFQKFHKMVSLQYNMKIQVVRSDNGSEYVNTELLFFFDMHGIVHQTTCPYTPQQNGVAEWKNRHLLEMVRASLLEACLPLYYWGDALMSAAYLINRLPSRTLEFQTPFQTLMSLLSCPCQSLTFLFEFLVARLLSTCTLHKGTTNWNLELFDVCLWGMLLLRTAIGAITHPPRKCLSLPMSFFMKHRCILVPLSSHFRGVSR